MNSKFNHIFVSVCKVNLSEQPFYVVIVKKYSSEVGGTQLQKTKVVVRRKQKVGNPWLKIYAVNT